MVRATQVDPSDPSQITITKQEAIADSFVFLFAGHESTANTIHYAFLFLAISLASQNQLQSSLDAFLSDRPPESWTYESDFPLLLNSFAGAIMNETLRVLPPIIALGKVTHEPQQIHIDGKAVRIPANTHIQFNVIGVQRDPRYWPSQKSQISDKEHDLDDFVAQRWLPSYEKGSNLKAAPESVSDEGLFVPRKGAFIPFSEGARGCPAKRFAQTEIIASLAVIFKVWSVELDVGGWTSDEEVEKMVVAERKVVYEKAIQRARKLMAESESIVTLQMLGESVPIRFVKRGRERFKGCYV